MRRVVAVLGATVLFLSAAPAHAGRMKTLGTDPSGDAPPSLDITYLAVGRAGKMLEIRIGVSGMFPGTGGIPAVPATEWIFKVRGRTFVAEAVPDRVPDFYLFERKDGGYQQLESPTGTFNAADGYASILVPLKNIGARSGDRIAGVEGDGGGDVDYHVHAGPETVYPDVMSTSKHFVVP